MKLVIFLVEFFRFSSHPLHRLFFLSNNEPCSRTDPSNGTTHMEPELLVGE